MKSTTDAFGAAAFLEHDLGLTEDRIAAAAPFLKRDSGLGTPAARRGILDGLVAAGHLRRTTTIGSDGDESFYRVNRDAAAANVAEEVQLALVGALK